MNAFVFSCVLILALNFDFCVSKKITKRSLLFPTSTVLQFTYGLSLPMMIQDKSVTLSTCFQANYDLPKTLKDVQIHEIKARSVSNNPLDFEYDRIDVYKLIMQLIESMTFDGEECLALMICEIAKHPFAKTGRNLQLEKLAHFIFTPSASRERCKVYSCEDKYFMSKFLQAEKYGSMIKDCSKMYSTCGFSFVQTFSKLYKTSNVLY